MSLLQDPLAEIDQAIWYLDNKKREQFPGAFELAAGNLCRQILEQVLFLLCVFSGMDRKRFLRRDRNLKVAGQLISELNQKEPNSKRSYWELARRRGPRIRKFARFPQTLRKWQHILNEPSHYSTKFRIVDEVSLRSFLQIAHNWFDDKDGTLLVAALNEILSDGRITATLNNDTGNTPGICEKVIMTAHNLTGSPSEGLKFTGPQRAILVLSGTEIPRGRWPRVPVLVQHTRMSIGAEFVTKRGIPINLGNFEEIMQALSTTAGERSYLSRRLRTLGFEITFIKERVTSPQRTVSGLRLES
jgi:hypothetical protein